MTTASTTQPTARQRYLQRKAALWTERSSWDAHWREINDHLLPRSGRFFDDSNRGVKKHNNIYDSTGTRALRVLAAGMMAGMTSPARPWFRLSTPDPGLAEYAPVKEWLHAVSRLMRTIFDRSNTYRALHTVYEELGAFGTAATVIEDDFDNVLHHFPLTVGEYAVSADRKGNINTLYRQLRMTVAQAVEAFGYDACSATAKNLYDTRNLDAWITVYHAIQPRLERDYGRRDAKHMPFASCYFEAGSDAAADGNLLRESGYQTFPALVPRWSASGGDIYGSGPGMDALGDIKQLQHEQLRKAECIDYKTRPPLQVPTAYKNLELDMLPGGVSYVDAAGQQSGIRTAFETQLDLSHLLNDIGDVRSRINQTFYADLFLMLANDTRSNITAREIAERHEEKLLMLGPVLERLHNELLDPLIEITFSKIVAAGILPDPPREIAGSDLRVEFVSMLAQAQRAVGLSGIDRLIGTIGAIAQAKPEVLDKLNGDQIVDNYADMLGVDPELIVADDQVAIIRKQRVQQQMAMQQAAAMPAMADTAKTMADTDTDGKNALTDMTRALSGRT